jgi:hypothetical protein
VVRLIIGFTPVVVTEKSSAVVRHIIHGEKAFKFDGAYLLWVRTTRVRE